MRAVLLVFVLTCWRHGGAREARGTPTPTHLFVTRVGPCGGESGTGAGGALPVSVSEMRIARKLYDFSVSGELNISVDIDDGWQLKLWFHCRVSPCPALDFNAGLDTDRGPPLGIKGSSNELQFILERTSKRQRNV
ncbi:hypothetical protein EVAR_86342_1 [Eumeta japonica]|uniref:Uncharacterized protein n=1 Tax=Eumeta variegata TaxID=151549 RepID=A0A4C1X4W0_EUMVA|nr:hypothetical protein EVAR_86342_1 [Eumeta japonica]